MTSVYSQYTSAQGNRMECYQGSKGAAIIRVGDLNYDVQLDGHEDSFLCSSIEAMCEMIGFDLKTAVTA